MRIAIFGGSFDPVHREHVRLVKAAVGSLGLDKVIIMPSCLAPHKRGGARAAAADRLEMAKIAFGAVPQAEVSDYELRAGGTSYSYLTCRHFRELYPDAERYFLVGADMLENFFSWYKPEDITENVVIAAAGRVEELDPSLHDRFRARFHKDFAEIPFVGEAVSSTAICVSVAFREATGGVGLEALDPAVLRYIGEHGLYAFPEQAAGLLLEKPSRILHSYRVALMACKRSKSLGIPLEKALIATMLHDCGKYVSLSSPLLAGFRCPPGVPEPVLHQYTGAYLAEHSFGVSDAEILDAIRYHTSGREGMGRLEKLVFLSDMLEDGRYYDGVEALRALFWRDLNACLKTALCEQLAFLRASGRPVYPLTERAAEWAQTLPGAVQTAE